MEIIILILLFYLATVILSYGYLFSYLQNFDDCEENIKTSKEIAKDDYKKDQRNAILTALRGPIALNYIISKDYHKKGLKFW